MILPLPPSYATMRRCVYVIVLLLLGWFVGRLQGCSHERHANNLARVVAEQEQALERLGFELAELRRHPERATPAIEPPAGTTPLAGTRTVTKPGTFQVPCEPVSSAVPVKEPLRTPSGEVPGAAGPVPPAAPSLPVLVKADVQTLLLADAASRIWADTTVDVTLSTASWSETQRLPADRLKSTVQVAPELHQALEAWRDRPARLTAGMRPPRQWRAGWVMGVGGAYDLVEGRFVPAAFIGWGVQF